MSMTIPHLPRSCPVGEKKRCNGGSQFPPGHGLEQITVSRCDFGPLEQGGGHVSIQFHGIKQLWNRQLMLTASLSTIVGNRQLKRGRIKLRPLIPAPAICTLLLMPSDLFPYSTPCTGYLAPFQAKIPPGYRSTFLYPSFLAQTAPLWLRVHLTKPQ